MYFVYLLASRPHGTLYIGWTTNLARRVWDKNKVVPGFTTKYGVDRLIWFESYDDREAALRREKQIKGDKTDIGSISMTICPMRNGHCTMDPGLRRDGASGGMR